MTVSRLFDINEKKVVVTGAGRGIGRVLALALAEAGANVAICGRTTDRTPVVAEIETMGCRASFAQVDITDSAEIEPFVSQVIARLGKIDILVNNAGIGTRGQSLETIEDVA